VRYGQLIVYGLAYVVLIWFVIGLGRDWRSGGTNLDIFRQSRMPGVEHRTGAPHQIARRVWTVLWMAATSTAGGAEALTGFTSRDLGLHVVAVVFAAISFVSLFLMATTWLFMWPTWAVPVPLRGGRGKLSHSEEQPS
jgi:hypothetical protein